MAEENEFDINAREVEDAIYYALTALRTKRPQGRDDPHAREWSVAITELEKVMAYFTFYVVEGR